MRSIRGYRLFITFTFIIITVLIPSRGFADVVDFKYNFGLGTFQCRSQSPGQSLRFTMLDIISGPINAGWRTSTGTSWTNTWAEKKNYRMDYEMVDVHVAISYGINNRFEFGFFFENRSFFGGNMDNAIEGFHDLFNINQDGRDEVDHNLSRVILRDDNRNILSEFSADKFENNGVGFVFQYILHPGTTLWPAVCINGQLRYAIKEPAVMNDHEEPFDTYIGMGLSKRFSEYWYSYFNMGYTHYGQTEFDRLEFDSDSLSGVLAIAYGWTPNLSLLVQYIFHEGVINGLDSLTQYSHEVVLGLKWITDHGGTVELGLIENIVETDNSPDVGLHFAYSFRY